MADLDDEIQARIDKAVAAATAPLLAEIAALKGVDVQDAKDDAALAARVAAIEGTGVPTPAPAPTPTPTSVPPAPGWPATACSFYWGITDPLSRARLWQCVFI